MYIKQKIYIDCTSTIRTRLGSGIQRVVNQLLSGTEYISSSLEVEVIPICNQFCNYYTVEDAESMNENSVQEYNSIEFSYNDIYFCPDAFWSCEIYQWYEYFKSRGVLIVTSVYDLIPLDPRNFTSIGDKKLFLEAFEVIVSLSDVIVSPSESTRLDIKNFLSNIKNFDIIPNLKVARISPIPWDSSHAIKNQCSHLHREPFLLMVGTVEKRRGYIETVDSLKPYWQKGGSLRLTIVGKLADRIIADKLIAYQEQGYPVELKSNVDDVELLTLYRQAKAIVCSSKMEGYGFSVAEGLQLNGIVLANKLSVFGEFAGSMPYYYDLEEPTQFIHLIEKIETLKPIKSPIFPAWEECYQDLVEVFAEISPYHTKFHNVASQLTDSAIVYATYAALELEVPDLNASQFWINNYPKRTDFISEILSMELNKTTKRSVSYVYYAFGLDIPAPEIIEFWVVNYPKLTDFINECKRITGI